MKTVRFYFDYISHNAYVAWYQLKRLALKHEFEIDPAPVLFAGLLNAHGSVGPAEIPAKTRWMIRDVQRKALDLGLPLEPPASHPFRPLLSLRVTGAIEDRESRCTATQALLDATWAHSVDVSDEAAVRRVLEGARLPGAELVTLATEAKAKTRLRNDTDDAIKLGVFGVPSMITEGRLFWGYDDLINLERYLEGNDPLEGYEIPSWAHVRPTAQRRRP